MKAMVETNGKQFEIKRSDWLTRKSERPLMCICHHEFDSHKLEQKCERCECKKFNVK